MLTPPHCVGDNPLACAVPEARRDLPHALVLRLKHCRVRARRVEALPQDLLAQFLRGVLAVATVVVGRGLTGVVA